MCLCYLYSGKETGGQEEWIQVREKSKWSKYQKFIKNLFSQQFINSLYFPRNLSHHEDLGVARFLPRFDEEFDYFLIISPTKKIIHISFYKTKKPCRLLTRVEKVCQKLNVCKMMKLTMWNQLGHFCLIRLILRCWGNSSILCQQNSDAL